MKEYIQGYIFIPITHSRTSANIIRTIVQCMEVTRTIHSVYIWREENEDWMDVPLSELCHIGRGGIHMYIDGLDCSWQFAPNAAGYHTIHISIYNQFNMCSTFETAFAMFITRWIAFCEEVQAELGYFRQPATGQGGQDEEMLAALQQRDLSTMLARISPYWKLYLAPALVTHETEQLLTRASNQCLEAVVTNTLPSGALFVRTVTQAVGAGV